MKPAIPEKGPATARTPLAFFILVSLLVGLGVPLIAAAQEGMVLKYTGRYESQPGPDKMQDVAVISDDYLAVVSSTGLSIVDRSSIAVESTTRFAARYDIMKDEPSNLDGARIGDAHYTPKFFHVVSYPPYLYASSRFDGVWIFRVDYSNGRARGVVQVGRLMRPREFTEGIAILDDKLYLTHHADGIEVLDLLPNPESPRTITTLTWDEADAWGIAPQKGGSVWVADGRAGVKLFSLQDDLLVELEGEDRTTSPGHVFDLAAANGWVVAAVGGQGVSVYEESTGLRAETVPLKGVCVDIKKVSASRLVAACRGWAHVVEVNASGQVDVLASRQLHRRVSELPQHKGYSYHLGAGAVSDGSSVYVAGWHHLDAYDLLANDPDDDPDLEISSQRAHFGSATESVSLEIANGGQGLLELEEPECSVPGMECSLGSRFVAPGDSTQLSISYTGHQQNLTDNIDIRSNEAVDNTLRVLAVLPSQQRVEVGESAPDFTGTILERNYRRGTFVEETKSLSDWSDRRRPVHFAIFGTWCPACLPAVASMTADISLHLPKGSDFFLVNPEGEHEVLRHVMEKIYIPIPIYLDDSGAVNVQYSQPNVGLPFGRSYVVDTDGIVTMVGTGYDPAPVLKALEQALR